MFNTILRIRLRRSLWTCFDLCKNSRALEHLERFCRQVSQGLETLTFEERQQLLRLVVERITVDNGRIRIERCHRAVASGLTLLR